jgi:alanyl-tRNA synthetase
MPSNTGAGYVIRRILRRAIRYGFTFEYQRTFYLSIGSCLADQMGGFPEIRKQQGLVTNVIREEETSFAYTGSRVTVVRYNATNHGKEVPGAKAFELYDTLVSHRFNGFRERGFSLDEAGFDKAMLEQKTRSRAASEVSTDDWKILVEEIRD